MKCMLRKFWMYALHNDVLMISVNQNLIMISQLFSPKWCVIYNFYANIQMLYQISLAKDLLSLSDFRSSSKLNLVGYEELLLILGSGLLMILDLLNMINQDQETRVYI